MERAGCHAVPCEYNTYKHNRMWKYTTPLRKIQKNKMCKTTATTPTADNPRLDPGHIDKKQMAQKKTATLYL
jgi:hypothetical protein